AGHRKHDGFGALELLLINREARNVTHAGQHAKHIFQWAHFPEHLELGQEIVEVERRAPEFLLETLRVFDLDALGRFLDQANDVAHSENPASQALRDEGFELIELLAGADEFDWSLGDLAHRQRRAAARVAVEFGQNNSGDFERLVEVRCDANGLLTSRGVDDKKRFLWL